MPDYAPSEEGGHYRADYLGYAKADDEDDNAAAWSAAAEGNMFEGLS